MHKVSHFVSCDANRLDVSGLAQVYASASQYAIALGELPAPSYALDIVSRRGGKVMTSAGVEVHTAPLESMWRVTCPEAIRMKLLASALILTLCATCAACAEPAMRLTSADMKDGAALAGEHYYTRCGGRNVSPDLRWTGSGKATSYALTLIDRTVMPAQWSHWIVLDIPAGVHQLPRGAPLPAGTRSLASDFGDLSYDGPCPPAGSGVHHYDFTVYAFVGSPPAIPQGATAKELSSLLSSASVAHASLSVTAETRK